MHAKIADLAKHKLENKTKEKKYFHGKYFLI